jgi:hypothetical protein
VGAEAGLDVGAELLGEDGVGRDAFLVDKFLYLGDC